MLANNRVDSLSSFTYSYGETDESYVFAANYQETNIALGGLSYHDARIIAIDKATNSQTIKTFAAANDTTHFIVRLQVINDTIHLIRVKSWREQTGNGIYHFYVYSEKYGSQLQMLSSKLLYIVDDPLHNIDPANLVFFKDDVYIVCANQLLVNTADPVSLERYSIYDRKMDTAMVTLQRLNPTPTPNLYGENAKYISKDDSGNILLSASFAHDFNSWSTYKDQIIVKLLKADNYAQPMEIRYHNYDSTADYMMVPAGGCLPYVQKRKDAYYFVSKSVAEYFDTTAGVINNHNFGIYKGHFRDSCVMMDRSYNTKRNLTYTTVGITVGQFRANQPLVFKGDTILFVYAGNKIGGDNYPNPCQDSLSGLELLALDTNLAEIRKFTVVNYQRNADPYGFDFTQDGGIMVYGALCPRGAPRDSLSLFAFLIDFKTGYPLNIFNAEGFVNTSMYKVYPSPFCNELWVAGGKSSTATISLYDLQGRKMLTQSLQSYKTGIDTRALPPGLYIYQVADAAKGIHQTGKVMKRE